MYDATVSEKTGVTEVDVLLVVVVRLVVSSVLLGVVMVLVRDRPRENAEAVEEDGGMSC